MSQAASVEPWFAQDPLVIPTLAVIGLGLIGGSFALVVRQAGLVRHIIGYDTDATNLARGLELGVVDAAAVDIPTAVRQADLVFVAVPVGAMRTVFAQMHGQLAAETLVTDGGSTKQSVIADFQVACATHVGQFIPGHPIAGKETSGVQAATADLYQQRSVILTPIAQNTAVAIQAMQTVWQACGAEVVCMSAARHDQIVAATSHLPHMLAFSLMHLLGEQHDMQDLRYAAAGGLRDLTRIAASNPRMWCDIAIANKTALRQALQTYRQQLQCLESALETEDDAALLTLFAQAQRLRQQCDIAVFDAVPD